MKTGRLIVISLAVFVAAAIASDSSWARGSRGGGGGRSWSGGSGHHGGGYHGGGYHGGGYRGGHHYHGGARVGIGIGFIAAPLYFPSYYYPAPAYYYPPPAPGYYIEQPQAGYWHYCPSLGAYYPHVQTCPGGWQLVAPAPRGGY